MDNKPATQAWYLTLIPTCTKLDAETYICESQTHKAKWEQTQENLLEAQWSVTDEDSRRRETTPPESCGMPWYFSLSSPLSHRPSLIHLLNK